MFFSRHYDSTSRTWSVRNIALSWYSCWCCVVPVICKLSRASIKICNLGFILKILCWTWWPVGPLNFLWMAEAFKSNVPFRVSRLTFTFERLMQSSYMYGKCIIFWMFQFATLVNVKKHKATTVTTKNDNMQFAKETKLSSCNALFSWNIITKWIS